MRRSSKTNRPVQIKLNTSKSEDGSLHLKKQISLENITFTYPGNSEPAINKLSMSISANSLVGVVGPSGSGKSTLIDILLGLITAQQGQLKIDDTYVSEKLSLMEKYNWVSCPAEYLSVRGHHSSECCSAYLMRKLI